MRPPRSSDCLPKARLSISSARTIRSAAQVWPWMKSSRPGTPVRRSANAPEAAHALRRFSAGDNLDMSGILTDTLHSNQPGNGPASRLLLPCLDTPVVLRWLSVSSLVVAGLAPFRRLGGAWSQVSTPVALYGLKSAAPPLS